MFDIPPLPGLHSTDPEFVTKLRDIVGLYVDPPAHAVVLSVDEKSQIRKSSEVELASAACGFRWRWS